MQLMGAIGDRRLQLFLGATKFRGPVAESCGLPFEGGYRRKTVSGLIDELLNRHLADLGFDLVDEGLHQLDVLVGNFVTGLRLTGAGGGNDGNRYDDRDEASRHGGQAQRRDPLPGSQVDFIDDPDDHRSHRTGLDTE